MKTRRTAVPSRWEDVVLICRKCSKRANGGFGEDGEQRLAKALRKALHGGRKRKARLGIIETGCLGLCPRDAVVAINARHPEQWQLITPGTSVEQVATQLGLRPASETTVSGDGTADRA